MVARAAIEVASEQVELVRDRPQARLALMRRQYEDPTTGARLPFVRAATAFIDWQLHRGLLEPPNSPHPGSPWWRAVNERLLLDTCEAHALMVGHGGTPSSPAVEAAVRFIEKPTARHWYRAHNISVVSAYLDNVDLGLAENRAERFFLNLVLLRVLFAHALVSAPSLALGYLAPVGPVLGDPRLGMTGMFLSIARVLPNSYPLGHDVAPYVQQEHGFGRLLDVGVIQPRLDRLYAWSADELAITELRSLLLDDIPVYVWDPDDRTPWKQPPTILARCARRFIPAD